MTMCKEWSKANQITKECVIQGIFIIILQFNEEKYRKIFVQAQIISV